MGERIERLFLVVEMALVSPPHRFRLFVVKKSGRHSLSDLFTSEPFNGAWLNSFTEELHRGRLSQKVLVSIVPSFSGSVVNLIESHLLSSSPVGHFETLEKGPWSSVEGDIFDSVSQSRGVEVLSVNVVHVVRFLMELLVIESVNSNTDFSGLLDMESVGDEGEVGVHKSHELGDALLNGTSGVEEHFNPSKRYE